jgi:dipeptidase E
MARALIFGGGGATHGTDPGLEDAMMTLLPRHPKIGYIGVANDDNPDRLARTEHRFTTLAASFTHLPKTATQSQAAAWAENLDAIYVGGGQTAKLLTTWRETGIEDVLRAVAARNVLLSGVSAGAMCWFDFTFWDGGGTNYQPLKGLGLFAGSCCVHYTTELERAAWYKDHVLRGDIPGGFAIGDGAGLYLDHAGHCATVEARNDTGVWTIAAATGSLEIKKVETPLASMHRHTHQDPLG